MFRSQNQTDGSTGEVVERSPDTRLNEQTLPGMIQQDGPALRAIVEGHSKGTAEGYDQLFQPLVGMASPTLACRHIVDPVGTLDVEGNNITTLGWRSINLMSKVGIGIGSKNGFRQSLGFVAEGINIVADLAITENDTHTAALVSFRFAKDTDTGTVFTQSLFKVVVKQRTVYRR